MACGMTDDDDDDEDNDHFGVAHITWFAAPPLYLMRAAERCPECGEAMHVYTLGCTGYHERGEHQAVDLFHFLREIESVPADILALLQAKCPGYFYDRTHGDEPPTLMNHCRCGGKLDDDYLHGDVGAAFFPDTPDGYAAIRLFTLPVDEPIPIVSSFMIGGDEFLDFGKAEPW
jgi:hypothetical protein